MPAVGRPQGVALQALGTYSQLIPVDTELAQPAPILYRGRVGAAQMQLLAQVERQFLRSLRFDDGSILLEGETMPVLQLVIRTVTG